jgi:hypothetical protein
LSFLFEREEKAWKWPNWVGEGACGGEKSENEREEGEENGERGTAAIGEEKREGETHQTYLGEQDTSPYISVCNENS